MRRALLAIVFSAHLAACGGGGGGGSGSGNSPPLAPAGLSYPSPNEFAVGKAIAPLTPTVTGSVSSYVVSPSLPAGLALNAATGVISGTPTAATATVSYTITASNSGGSTKFAISMTVNSVLLELGHGESIIKLNFSGSRVLSQDFRGHWVLWNYATAAIIASGDPPPGIVPDCSGIYCQPVGPFLDMAGPIFVRQRKLDTLHEGLEIRASADGRLLSTITASISWWKIASDGSYICGGGPAGLYAWAPSGSVLMSRKGNYSGAVTFAAPNEIRVAGGPAGLNAIETISVSTGTSTVGPAFPGKFYSWFLDGERFFAYVSTTVWIYSKAGVQEDFASLPSIDSLTGQGDYFWAYASNGGIGGVDIYKVGMSGSPVASYPGGDPSASGMTIGLIGRPTSPVTVIDLSGPTPTSLDFAAPINNLIVAYAATSNSSWLVANDYGLILDGASVGAAPRYFGIGTVFSIAGSDARVALATASGNILYFDAQTDALQGKISASVSRLALSSDGTVLAAWGAPSGNGAAVRIFSLPAGTEIYTWSNYDPLSLSLSDSATALGQVFWGGSGTYLRQVTAPTGGPVIWSDSFIGPDPLGMPIRLSPDGSLIAVSDNNAEFNPTTKIFKNGSQVATVPGWAVGWIDNGRLLVNSSIYDSSGAILTSPPLPLLQDFQRVTEESIYDASSNSILSLVTGTATWTSAHPSAGIGAVTGSNVVFLSQSGARVFSEPY